jgi:propanol-preferring alcohol dehydrogenase
MPAPLLDHRPAVGATPAALAMIRRLEATHGPLTFHQSGGCCDGSSAICLKEGELPPGPHDLQLGEIGGAPFYIDADQHRRWGAPGFVIDVAPGAADGFSLEGLEGVHFISRTPEPDTAETQKEKDVFMATATIPEFRTSEGVSTTYRAAVVHDFGSPLSVEHVPMPTLEAGQVRVKVQACGLCHTDIHAAGGDWPIKPAPPFIPGHEGVGIVTELGQGVSEVVVGDRVAMPWLGYACGSCDYCVSGWETLCLQQEMMGYTIDGGFGEYAVAYARYVVKVPEGLDSFDAAPLTCAGVTTYKAVKVAGTRSSDFVAVFGVGGLGHLAIQYAAIAGGRVVAVDVVEEKLELARELGAEFTINAAKEDPVAAIQKLGGVNQAIALAVSPRAFEQAYGSLRRGGTLVFVALPADNEVKIPIFQTVLNGITIVGSIVGTRKDLREVFELHAAGKTRVIRETRPLDQVNEAIADVEAGRVAARIVLEP